MGRTGSAVDGRNKTASCASGTGTARTGKLRATADEPRNHREVVGVAAVGH